MNLVLLLAFFCLQELWALHIHKALDARHWCFCISWMYNASLIDRSIISCQQAGRNLGQQNLIRVCILAKWYVFWVIESAKLFVFVTICCCPAFSWCYQPTKLLPLFLACNRRWNHQVIPLQVLHCSIAWTWIIWQQIYTKLRESGPLFTRTTHLSESSPRAFLVAAFWYSHWPRASLYGDSWDQHQLSNLLEMWFMAHITLCCTGTVWNCVPLPCTCFVKSGGALIETLIHCHVHIILKVTGW